MFFGLQLLFVELNNLIVRVGDQQKFTLVLLILKLMSDTSNELEA